MVDVVIDGWIVALGSSPAGSRSSGYYWAPIPKDQDAAFRARVREVGGKVLEKVHVPGEAARTVNVYLYHNPRGVPLADGSEAFPNEAKLATNFLGILPGSDGVRLDEILADLPAALTELPRQRVHIDFHTTVKLDENLEQRVLVAAGATREEATFFPEVPYTVPPNISRVRPAAVVLSTSGNQLRALLDIDEVRRASPIPAAEYANNQARMLLGLPTRTSGARKSNAAAGNKEFTGAGEVIAITDSGFDRGDPKMFNYAFVNATKDDTRVRAVISLGGRCMGDDPVGHGTHVAGSAVGAEDFITAEDDGTPDVYGVAHGAELVVQAVFKDNFGPLWGLDHRLNGAAANLEDHIFDPPYKDYKSRVHSNSWGRMGAAGIYGQARTVDSTVENRRDLVILFCAGNSGKPTSDNQYIEEDSSIWDPGTAKNCITVGASENHRDFCMTWSDNYWNCKFSRLPTRHKSVAGNPEAMAPFSSRGPVNRRIKPDVVAPGTAILSTRSYISQEKSNGWSEREPRSYMYWSGTSMATPLVAGCAAIVRQYLRNKVKPDPSAALVKAALINGARPITGPYSGLDRGGTIPNNHQGFGRVDVAAAIGLDGSKVHFFDETPERALSATLPDAEAVPLATWQLPNPQFPNPLIVPTGHTFKVTLVWVDPSDSGTLQHDLNLIVRSGTEVRHGNMTPEASANGEFDTANNVEQVVWDTPPQGQVTVEVNGSAVGEEPQMFALVYSVKKNRRSRGNKVKA